MMLWDESWSDQLAPAHGWFTPPLPTPVPFGFCCGEVRVG